MLLLVTGASGSGKSSARRAVEPVLPASVEAVELSDVVAIPAVPDVAWRQQAAEVAVRRAIALTAAGRHLLLCGDPVAPGEIVAAPSFGGLDGFAASLLDVTPDVQRERLAQRGDPPELFDAHVAFAAWMRGHARDPRHRLDVLTTAGWDAMRWAALPAAWEVTPIDGDGDRQEVAAELLAWIERSIAVP